jgi:hypothetical protein
MKAAASTGAPPQGPPIAIRALAVGGGENARRACRAPWAERATIGNRAGGASSPHGRSLAAAQI